MVKSIAREVVVRDYELVVSDRELSLYRKNKRLPEEESDDNVRKIILIDYIKSLIGDIKRRESTYIYSENVSCIQASCISGG